MKCQCNYCREQDKNDRDDMKVIAALAFFLLVTAGVLIMDMVG